MKRGELIESKNRQNSKKKIEETRKERRNKKQERIRVP